MPRSKYRPSQQHTWTVRGRKTSPADLLYVHPQDSQVSSLSCVGSDKQPTHTLLIIAPRAAPTADELPDSATRPLNDRVYSSTRSAPPSSSSCQKREEKKKKAPWSMITVRAHESLQLRIKRYHSNTTTAATPPTEITLSNAHAS